MFYYVYILQSLENESLYIGYTSDLRRRLQEHNLGQNKATKPFIPYRLIHYEAFLQKRNAVKREEYLKGGYGGRTINKMLSGFFESP